MRTAATFRASVWLLALALLGACRTEYIEECGTRTLDLEPAPPPRLVVQITIDQLRHDLLERGAGLASGDDGFRKLLREGAVFANARYTHTITETSVGHATLFTGALPRQHGIVGNEWYDLAARANVYAVDDASTTLVGGSGTGRSPKNLLVPTLGDVLRERSAQALVIAVSEKDRGAVLPAGRAGRAYWLDDASGRFVTSTYYGAQPAWFESGGGVSVESLRGKRWELSLPEDAYTAPDDVAWERSYKHLGRVFPHPLDAPVLKDFTRGIKYTPFADELVLAFVRELFAREELGKDDVADLLAVSFSATDYVGHAFGPESREAEDNLVRLDRTLAQLMALAEQAVGAGRVLFVLSADHGIAESPEWWLAQGIESGRLEPDELIVALNAALRRKLGVSADLVSTFVNPALYLDEAKVRELGLELAKVEAAVVELVPLQPGFARAFSRSAALSGQLEGDELGRRVAASMHPERSGHVYLVPKKHWLLVSDPHELAAMHGTPWPYDSHVPIVFWGAGVKAQRSWRRVDPRDIAPTLARVLGVPPPSGSSGTDLGEVQLR